MYTLSEIASMMNATAEGDTLRSDNWLILIDSRTVVQPERSVFFALRSHHNDGHQYIPELIQKGVKVFVTGMDYVLSDAADVTFLRVPDTLKALQQLAATHRQHFNIPVIGITGSNGKTIVKEWLSNLLGAHYFVCASPKSYNSQIGVPISVWQLDEPHTIAIFEAGISRPGEMQTLRNIIQPSIGILTHMGSAHDEGFDNFEQKVAEKLILFEETDMVLLKYDPNITRRLSVPFQTFGLNEPGADMNIVNVNAGHTDTELIAIYKGDQHTVKVPFTDEASLENICTCWLATLYLGVFNPADFMQLNAISMRLELKQAINNCLLINDSYSNDLNALSTAFSFMKRQSVHQQTSIILSEIEQSGLPERELCMEVDRILTDNRIGRFFAVGEVFHRNSDLFKGTYAVSFYKTTEDFLQAFEPSLFANETILLKGARSFRFETIAARLEKQTHGTILEIDLTAVEHNLNYIKGRLPSDMKIMAMVKAFAYGSGSYEIARLLEKKVNYLAVAYTDEGVTLRQNGLSIPVMVMNADDETFHQCIRYDLEPVIFSLSQLQTLLRMVGEQHIRVHLEFDTGMHRLGFASSDLDELIRVMGDHPNLKVASVFSHLSASDEAIYDDFTTGQFSVFKTICDRLTSALSYPFLKHISNTTGALRFQQNGFNMVRLGIGLYGIDPSGEHQKMLETVFTLKTTVSQVKTIAPNESIGYGRKGIENRERRIAILAIGYADGMNRLLSNGKGSFLIGGKQAPVIGNVCMDMCMVDVSGISCREGDEAILFGRNKSIIDLAEQLQTIPYEILTSVSQRVKRVYISE